MITKERLEELIKQGATIYEAKYHDTNPVDLSKREVRCISSRYNAVAFEPKPNERWKHNKYFDKLFETKEEAEWYLEFGNIKGNETLSFPKYEKLPKELDIPPFIRYNKELENFVLYEMFNSTKNEICIVFRELDDDASDCLFRKPLTKENYIEACKICKKLFLGEEVCQKK